MTNGECIYRKTVDYMSRMALENDDFRRFSVICRGARCIKVGNGPLKTLGPVHRSNSISKCSYSSRFLLSYRFECLMLSC